MNYCRQSEDSDVYVIGTDGALECCGCSLYKYSFQVRRYSKMIAHLKYHEKAGQKVPARAFARLKEESQQHADLYRYTNKRKLVRNVRKTKGELLEREFYKEMDYVRKQAVEQSLEIFEHVYGRKPTRLELSGIAKAAEIELDLQMGRVLE